MDHATSASRIARSLLDPVVVLDTEGLIYDINQAMERVLNLEFSLLAGRSISEFFDQSSDAAFQQVCRDALNNPGTAHLSEVLLRANLHGLSRLRFSLMALPESRPALLVLVGRSMQQVFDFTRELASLNEDLLDRNRRLARSNWQLSRERAHLTHLHQLSRRLSQSLDLHDVMQHGLAGARDMFAATDAALLLLNEQGQPDRWLATPDVAHPTPETLERALRHGSLAAALQQQQALCLGDVLEHYPDGPHLVPGAAMLVAPLVISSQPLGLLLLAHHDAGSYSDDQEPALTAAAETIALAMQNAQLYTRLRESEAMREHMINLLVHDIRSPLMGTHAGVQVVQRALAGQTVSPMVDEALDSALRTIRTVVGLTNDLLDIKRLQLDSSFIEIGSIQVDILFDDVIRLMHGLALQRQVRLAAIIQPEAACVQADSGLLRRVLVNMVANGLRFTPEGSCITLRAEPDAQRGVVLVVEDQGPGVPLDEQERIFQPFVQGKGEAQRGSGLGLAFCREVVLAHKGRIWVENQPAGGCHFSIWLPNAESSQQIEHGA